MKIALLSSKNQWFVPYAKALKAEICEKFPHFECEIFYEHGEILGFDIVFILSYHKIIPAQKLAQNALNLIIHASPLPRGKGWSPLFWQILEGKNEVVFTLFEADENVDSGAIYLQKSLNLSGLELYEELRNLQAQTTKQLCLEFLALYPNLSPRKQSGEESFYAKRSPKDSELDPKKSLNELFNQLRICSNDEFPAFFYKNGKKFVLKIYD